MKLYSTIFRNSNPLYKRMSNALEASVAANSPSTPITVEMILDTDEDLVAIGKRRYATYVQNTRKSRHHSEIVQRSEDGELICLMDCDTLVVKDLSPAIKLMEGFDLGYTVKPRGANYKINSGVVFVRVSERTRKFYRDWEQATIMMLSEPKQHEFYRKNYGGVNQSALAYTMANNGSDMKYLELPCQEWNACSDSWKDWQQHARIIHVLMRMRRLVSRTANRVSKHCDIYDLVMEWFKYANVSVPKL